MGKNFFNEEHFDFKKLALDERFIKTKTDNCEYAFSTCLEVADNKTCVGLITEPGYGTRSGIEDFIKKSRKYKESYGQCSREKPLKAILTDFLMHELPPFVKIHETSEDYLIEALSHHFKNIDAKRKRIMIFYSTESWVGLRPFSALYRLSSELKNETGILISINASRFRQLQKLASKHSDINNFLSSFDWRELPPPSLAELGQHCFNRGVYGKRIVDRLLNKASDFRILNMEINKIRDLLVKKGYLKTPN